MTRLPDFPWDKLAPLAARAREHPDGIVDLSVGTPVDPTPPVVQRALAAAADAPGYPLTVGSVALREAAVGWLARRLGVHGLDAATQVLPTVGSKELVALLPSLLGARSVGFPRLAYPTYDVGARLAGARGVAVDGLAALGPDRLDLLWINSPANPTGAVLPVEHLAKVVAWARERGTLVVSDECYCEFGWDATPVSVLHPSVCGGSFEGVLAVHSLSKRSNMAGYRSAFVAGDPAVLARLLEVRKHAGLMVSAPVQAAMVAALGDDLHVEQQRARYAARRTTLLTGVQAAGLRVEASEGGLYLWATRDEPCWETAGWLAERGVLVAPGDFYGAAGASYVRIALTATDERIATGATRLAD